MSFVYGLMMVCFVLIFVYSLLRSIDDKSATRGEDLFRAIVMVALILVINRLWR